MSFSGHEIEKYCPIFLMGQIGPLSGLTKNGFFTKGGGL